MPRTKDSTWRSKSITHRHSPYRAQFLISQGLDAASDTIALPSWQGSRLCCRGISDDILYVFSHMLKLNFIPRLTSNAYHVHSIFYTDFWTDLVLIKRLTIARMTTCHLALAHGTVSPCVWLWWKWSWLLHLCWGPSACWGHIKPRCVC